MDLVNRYLYAVTRLLPEKSRAEIEGEVRASISDMLPDNPTEEQVRKVLVELGSPSSLARKYDDSPRYLIGPGLYEIYVRALKLVVGMAAGVAPLVTLVVLLLRPAIPGATFGTALGWIGQLIGAAVQAAVAAAACVTIVFVIVERVGVPATLGPRRTAPWTPDDLPVVPSRKGRRISKAEVEIGIAWTVFWTALILFAPTIFSVRVSGAGVQSPVPILDVGRLHFYAPLVVIVFFLSIGLSSLKLAAGRWTTPVAVLNALSNTVAAILIVLFAADVILWNAEALARLGSIMHLDLSPASDVWLKVKEIGALVVIIACGIDTAVGFSRARKAAA
jgi:hypothetical protein